MLSAKGAEPKICFAKVKSVMKENEVLHDAGEELETLILMGFASITQDDCKGWIANAGY